MRGRTIATVILAATMAVLVPLSVSASTSFFGWRNHVCLMVYDIQADRKYLLRELWAPVVAAEAQKYATKHGRKIKVDGGLSKCHPLNSDRQVNVELWFYKFTSAVADKILQVAVIGGSSSNVQGQLSPYEIAPISIIQEQAISDEQIQRALIDFVNNKVLSLP